LHEPKTTQQAPYWARETFKRSLSYLALIFFAMVLDSFL
jgi:heme O synthase-like polyprenyltransferase